jgi:4-alpha-glucanotransferase
MSEQKRHDHPRLAGVLLHPTSLPGPYGIGDLGRTARDFVDWLAAAGMSVWQILPLVPTGGNGSPYSSWSAFAGNPDLIDVEGLVALGLLAPADTGYPTDVPSEVDFDAVRRARRPALDRAVATLLHSPTAAELRRELAAFRAAESWVEDTALFAAIKAHHGGKPWWEWPRPLGDREPAALEAARREHAAAVDREVALQFLFARQWRELRAYAAARGVRFLGDMPIYVDGDSVDVWAHRANFELDARGRPTRVAGVPPDAFSATGQHWGNPLFAWERMAKDGYSWWRARLARALELSDWVRIDHFRAFAAYWAIPAGAADARSGQWVPGPGKALFDAFAKVSLDLPIVAEDLGIIDEPVRALRDSVGLPGMLVLQFAFGETAANPYLPHNHRANAVVYTGTHDNDTTLNWWRTAPESIRDHVRHYLGRDGHDVVWDLIRASLASPAWLAVVPMQDLLQLGAEGRMNRPSEAEGNWRWRLQGDELRPELGGRLRFLAQLYGRVPKRG